MKITMRRLPSASSWPPPGIAILLFAAVLVACAVRPQPEPVVPSPSHHEPGPAAGQALNIDAVTIDFCTNRTRDPGAEGFERLFGADPGEASYGRCVVSIPREHHMIGNIERPSVFRGEFHEHPDRDVMIQSIDLDSADGFFAALGRQVGGSHQHAALVFIHGFNTSFAEAARRTAQIAYDLNFDGAPILFSWPAHAGSLGVARYDRDGDRCARAVPILRDFLAGLAARSGAERIFLIAHSMGARAASAALLALDPALARRFSEVVLAAPDIDAATFRAIIAPALVARVPRLTLYASSVDRVLRASGRINHAPRAGDSTPGVVVVPSMVTIDASAVDTSFLGHGYYAQERTVLDDIYYLFNTDLPAARRFGMWSAEQGAYYVFRP
jgi:esterase/lipase superfamily enzyme